MKITGWKSLERLLGSQRRGYRPKSKGVNIGRDVADDLLRQGKTTFSTSKKINQPAFESGDLARLLGIGSLPLATFGLANYIGKQRKKKEEDTE
jgi:hypothetical protein